MTSAPAESRPWSCRRWWGMVALVLIVQLALIFWLGDTPLIRRRAAAQTLTLRLAGSDSDELLALRDPTLFVLPHPERHSAPAWLKAPAPESRSIAWPEPAQPPLLAAGQPGVAFNRIVATNHPLSLPPLAKPRPQPTLPEPLSRPMAASQSAVRLEGALAQRRLISPISLRSWTSRDILATSVVQLIVDADGRPQSVNLLSGSGSREADQHALDQAGAARFEPVSRNPIGPAPKPTAHLSSGRMIFLWHSLPPAPTNAPAISP